MDIAVVGLGRMGANMARRLLAGGHRVVVANRSRGPVEELAAAGAVPAWTYEDVLTLLAPPRVVWLMLPAGGPTDEFVERFAELLSPDDLVVDGGNSYYKDSLRHAEFLTARGLRFVDSGTSGGIWGLAEGYSLMVGGDADSVARLRPALEKIGRASCRERV
jgi:6-phosphogluconate dehydrogenase